MHHTYNPHVVKQHSAPPPPPLLTFALHPLSPPSVARQAVGLLYRRPDLAVVSHLQDNIEDLFDACVAPYFPIMFTAPKNDTHRITRDMLLQRVLAAMACCPEFAPLAIPVLSEKLGSSLK